MDYFNYREDGELLAEQCTVSELVAQYGTPLYIYSRALLNVTGRRLMPLLATCRI